MPSRKRGRVHLMKDDLGVTLSFEGRGDVPVAANWTGKVVEENIYSFRRPFQMLEEVIVAELMRPVTTWNCYAEEGLVDCCVRLELKKKKTDRGFRHVRFQTKREDGSIAWAEGWTFDQELLSFARAVLADIFPAAAD